MGLKLILDKFDSEMYLLGMSIKPKTIDNLGIDASDRFAGDRAAFDETIIREAGVGRQAQIDVSEPAYVSEFDLLLGIGGGAPWATTAPPAGYEEQKNRLFAEQIVPRFGSPDKQDALLEKVKEMEIGGKSPTWDPKQENLNFEKQTLVTLLTKMKALNKDAIEIYEGRNLYHRG